jgi:hypothetical protein
MGIYPSFELNYHAIKETMMQQISEINQPTPRLLKANLIYYKIKKIISGPSNSALISDKGELLLQGMNETG